MNAKLIKMAGAIEGALRERTEPFTWGGSAIDQSALTDPLGSMLLPVAAARENYSTLFGTTPPLSVMPHQDASFGYELLDLDFPNEAAFASFLLILRGVVVNAQPELQYQQELLEHQIQQLYAAPPAGTPATASTASAATASKPATPQQQVAI